MPHYSNGQPAKVGELVRHVPPHKGASTALGVLVSITPGESCNGQLLPVARKWEGTTWLPVLPVYQECVTLKDCHPVDEPEAKAAAPSAT